MNKQYIKYNNNKSYESSTLKDKLVSNLRNNYKYFDSIIAVYKYNCNIKNNIPYYLVRFSTKMSNKNFNWVNIKGGICNTGKPSNSQNDMLIYKMNNLKNNKEKYILLIEGEKDVDRAIIEGIPAVYINSSTNKEEAIQELVRLYPEKAFITWYDFDQTGNNFSSDIREIFKEINEKRKEDKKKKIKFASIKYSDLGCLDDFKSGYDFYDFAEFCKEKISLKYLFKIYVNIKLLKYDIHEEVSFQKKRCIVNGKTWFYIVNICYEGFYLDEGQATSIFTFLCGGKANYLKFVETFESSSFNSLLEKIEEHQEKNKEEFTEDKAKAYINRYISALEIKHKSKEELEELRGYLFSYLLSSHVLLYDLSYKNNLILGLYGTQGCGKTEFLEPLGVDLYKTHPTSLVASPRLYSSIRTHFIVLEEDEALSRSSGDMLKRLTSGRKMESVHTFGNKRRNDLQLFCNVAFTTNNKNIIKDDTGTRRFLIFEVLKSKSQERIKEIRTILNETDPLHLSSCCVYLARHNNIQKGYIEDLQRDKKFLNERRNSSFKSDNSSMTLFTDFFTNALDLENTHKNAYLYINAFYLRKILDDLREFELKEKLKHVNLEIVLKDTLALYDASLLNRFECMIVERKKIKDRTKENSYYSVLKAIRTPMFKKEIVNKSDTLYSLIRKQKDSFLITELDI